MPKFVFHLEAVLTQREHVERQRQRELAIVQSQFAKLEGELRALNERVTTATEDLRQNHLTGVIDLAFLAAHRRFIAATQRQAMAMVQRMAVVRRDVEAAQLALAEAAKQRKVIEKLKERQFERWRAEQSRKELAELDEVNMQLSYQNSIETAEGAA
jgi:flagellar FliJ protein